MRLRINSIRNDISDILQSQHVPRSAWNKYSYMYELFRYLNEKPFWIFNSWFDENWNLIHPLDNPIKLIRILYVYLNIALTTAKAGLDQIYSESFSGIFYCKGRHDFSQTFTNLYNFHQQLSIELQSWLQHADNSCEIYRHALDAYKISGLRLDHIGAIHNQLENAFLSQQLPSCGSYGFFPSTLQELSLFLSDNLSVGGVYDLLPQFPAGAILGLSLAFAFAYCNKSSTEVGVNLF